LGDRLPNAEVAVPAMDEIDVVAFKLLDGEIVQGRLEGQIVPK
jgi:hypothetical protein